MASSNTIREFLIGLGVDINTSDVNRFVTTVQGMTKEVERFALKLAAMTSMLQAAVVKTADALENLYYIAQRAGTTVSNLKTLQYAMAQVGLQASDANAALEGMAMALRINPGNESLLRFLGVATRDMRGNMRDTTAVMGDFLARLGKMPFYIAAQYAATFGINERTLFMLLRDFRELTAAGARWKELAKATGVDLETSSKLSRGFMNTLRETGEIVELIWIKIATVLIQRFQPQLERFNRFLIEHAKEIEGYATDVSKAILSAGEYIVSLLPQVDDLVKKTLGWKEALELVAGVIIYRIFGPIGLALYLMEKVIARLPDMEKYRPDTPGAPSSGDVYKRLNKPDPNNPDALQRFLNNLGNSIVQALKKAFEEGVQLPGYIPQSGGGFNPAFVHPASYAPEGGGSVTPASLQHGLDPRIEAEVRRRARSEGLDEEHMVRLARAEGGGMNKVSPAGAIGPMQLMPGTAKQMGVNPWNWIENIAGGIRYFAQQLKRFGSYAAADAAYNAGPKGRGVNYFALTGDPRFLPLETQRYILGINGARGGGRAAPGTGGAVIHQKTDIHVHGSEPRETARETARQQSRVNAELVRNFRTAVVA